MPIISRRRRLGTGGTPSNQNPSQPTISAGSLTSSGATLTGSAFSDPDVGDTHAASQWQVTTAADTGYATPVLNPGDDAVHKTSLAVTGLSASTNYISRVRYKDNNGNYSAWSTNASFTTAAGGATTYREDLFTRSGALSGSTPTDGGSAWVTDGSTFTTDGTKLNSPDSGAAAWLESSHADCVIRCTVTAAGGDGWGLRWRTVDGANSLVLRADINPGFLTPGTRAGGSNTWVDAQKFAYTTGDVIEIHCSAGISSFWKNGVDTGKAITPGVYDTATKHGVYTGVVTGTVSWDDFSVKSA